MKRVEPSLSFCGGARLTRRATLFGAAGLVVGGRAAAELEGPTDALRFLKVRHATFLFDLGELRVVTDPWLRRAPLGPLVLDAPEPALGADQLSQARLLLVTSTGWDRFDPYTLRALPTRELYCLVPDEDAARALRSAGYHRVRVTRAGDRWTVLGARVEVSPAGDGAVGYRLTRGGRSLWNTGPLAPLDVDDAPGRWIRSRPTEVVVTGYDPGPGARLGTALGMADAVLLGRLARARFVVPAGDDVLPSSGIRAAIGMFLPDDAPPAPTMRAPRVVDAERGRWYRVAREAGEGAKGPNP